MEGEVLGLKVIGRVGTLSLTSFGVYRAADGAVEAEAGAGGCKGGGVGAGGENIGAELGGVGRALNEEGRLEEVDAVGRAFLHELRQRFGGSGWEFSE